MTAVYFSPQQRRWALALIWLTPLLWTVNIVVARTAPGVVSPHVLALGRWALAGVLLAWVARQELWMHRHSIWAARSQYLALGACGMWICGAWVYWAGHTTQAMNISLIYAAAPVMIALGSVWWLGERLQKKWTSPLGSTARLAAMCAGGVVVLLPFALWELAQSSTPAVGAQAMGLMTVAALLPGVVAYWVYGWTQKVLGASRVAVTLYLWPLYTAVAAWLVLNEPLAWFHLLGGLMILGGVGLVVAMPSGPTKP